MKAPRSLHKTPPPRSVFMRLLKLVENEATHSDRVEEADLLASFAVMAAVLDIFRRRAMDAAIEQMLPAIEEKFTRLEGPKGGCSRS